MKCLLVAVDMQKDFVDGALGTKEAVSIVPKVKEKIISWLKKGNDVVFTRDTHTESYLQTAEGKKLPVAHCIKDTPGWEIISDLQPYVKTVFDKPTFGSLALAKYAADHAYDAIELIGLCTDICVISNALLLKAHLPECRIVVDPACCAGVTPQSHHNALEAMKMCQIDITESFIL